MYLNTLLSSKISERTNMLSRMKATSPVNGKFDPKKSSIQDTEPPSAMHGGKIPNADKSIEQDSLLNEHIDSGAIQLNSVDLGLI